QRPASVSAACRSWTTISRPDPPRLGALPGAGRRRPTVAAPVARASCRDLARGFAPPHTKKKRACRMKPMQKLVAAAFLVTGFSVLAAPAPAAAQPQTEPPADRGEYLARAGDCIACHSVRGGKAFAGGLRMGTPMGAIYSTNITPD